MHRLIGNPLSAASLLLAAWLLGMSFQAGELIVLSWIGLLLIASLLRSGYYKLLPAYLAGVTFQLVGMSWMACAYGSLELTEQRYLNWGLQALFFGAVFPLIVGLSSWLRRWPIWIVLPVVWTVGDFARLACGQLIDIPNPWLMLGYSQTGFLPVCQIADLGGVWAVGFVAALFAGTIAEAIHKRPPILPILLVVAAISYGLCRSMPLTQLGPRIALMPARQEDAPNADLALWPETAFDNASPARKGVNIFGCWRGGTDAHFNSVGVQTDGIQTDGILWYDKCNLVPWAESETIRGTQAGIFVIGRNRVGVAVCYDVCFGRFMRQLGCCDFILVAASESSDPTQQLATQMLAISRIRAIELRRSIVRNVNGGFSGVIDGNGHTDAIELTTPTVVTVPLDNRQSPYVDLGDWLPSVCVLAVFGLRAARRRTVRMIVAPARQIIPSIAIQNQSDS